MKLNLDKVKKSKSLKELLEFGIINIDKPQNPTSFDVSDFVRKVLSKIGVNKTSHFGTLDPKVTGVLPIALNRACKLTGFFLGEDKEYVGVMRIHEDIPLDKIQDKIEEKFTGKILQTPPLKSRVKRQERVREIKKFKLLEKNGKDILFISEVQGGTYIRKLIDDLGKELGIGAHMLELRRIRAGIFKEENSITLYDLEKYIEDYKNGKEDSLRRAISPGEIVSEIYTSIEVKEGSVKNILTGKPILNSDLKSKKVNLDNGKIISVFSGERFIGMYKVVNNGEIFAKPEFVMQPIR